MAARTTASAEGCIGRGSTSRTHSHGCSKYLVLVGCWIEGLTSSLAIGQKFPTVLAIWACP